MPKKFCFPSMKLYDGTTDPTYHITSYKQRMFTTTRSHGDLYHIHQCCGETLCDYVRHFNWEKVSIPFCNQEIAVDAFRKGLLPDGELYKDLTKFNCFTIEDILAYAWI